MATDIRMFGAMGKLMWVHGFMALGFPLYFLRNPIWYCAKKNTPFESQIPYCTHAPPYWNMYCTSRTPKNEPNIKIYALWKFNSFLFETGHRFIVSFPNKKWWIFNLFLLRFTRGYICGGWFFLTRTWWFSAINEWQIGEIEGEGGYVHQ